jgi:hypothetical protein
MLAATAILATTVLVTAATAQQTSPDTPLMADQVCKNIQALKGIPVDEFLQTMGLIDETKFGRPAPLKR